MKKESALEAVFWKKIYKISVKGKLIANFLGTLNSSSCEIYSQALLYKNLAQIDLGEPDQSTRIDQTIRASAFAKSN